MRISDELRDYGRRLATGTSPFNCTFGEIRAYQDELANRIDKEMVELPLSADGYVWTGREECFWTGPANEDWHKFCGLHYSDGRWCVEDVDFERYPAASVWYERPDGLERIADELEAWCDDSDVDGDACDVPRDLAKRIRKLAKEDDNQ